MPDAAPDLPAAGAGRIRLPGQETFPAVDGPPLGGLERDRRFPAALRTRGHGLGFGIAARRSLALGLTRLAALGLVLEILVVEEVLFSRCEYKICSAIYALEDAVLELRHNGSAP